jgi:hypothetical protein
VAITQSPPISRRRRWRRRLASTQPSARPDTLSVAEVIDPPDAEAWNAKNRPYRRWPTARVPLPCALRGGKK